MYSIVIIFALASCANCFNSEVDEKFHKLPHNEFIEYFNSQNFSWKIQKNDLHDKVFDCAEIIDGPISIKQAQFKEGYNLEEHFNAGMTWPRCFYSMLVRDQGACGSCWALTTTIVAWTRSCILNRKTSGPPLIGFPISPIDLNCCTDCFSKSFCSGGSPERAALHWIKNGLVTVDCIPYDSDTANKTSCKQECVNNDLYYNADKYFGESMYIMPADDHEIRFELMSNGPLIATFALYEDLKDYKNGVYEHTYGKLIGHHSVQVFGFGIENEVPYWHVMNSWGQEWGYNGNFKVKRFQEGLSFENKMIALIPRSGHYPV